MPRQDNVPEKPTVHPTSSARDPLEELRLAERAQEDTYLRKLDEELITALRQQDAAEVERAVRQYLHMRCPKCGAALQEVPYRSVKVDECPDCGGIWLDKGELEVLIGPKAEGWLQRLFEAFIPAH
jgi:hypothetical protein